MSESGIRANSAMVGWMKRAQRGIGAGVTGVGMAEVVMKESPQADVKRYTSKEVLPRIGIP